MGVPQLENGYTRIADELLEAIYVSGLTGQEIKFLLLLIRMIYGFQKKERRIAVNEFASLGIKGSNFYRIRGNLIKMSIIHYHKGVYRVNKYYHEWGCGKAVDKLLISCGNPVDN